MKPDRKYIEAIIFNQSISYDFVKEWFTKYSVTCEQVADSYIHGIDGFYGRDAIMNCALADQPLNITK